MTTKLSDLLVHEFITPDACLETSGGGVKMNCLADVQGTMHINKS
jgi:hypothetical protein